MPRLMLAALAATLALAVAPAAHAYPAMWEDEWPRTDFDRSVIDDWSEIISGGPPKDGIPALTDPEFLPADAETRLSPREPVITVDIDGARPRAYPIRYLMWHEIVNDDVAGTPIAVTFCPLCNSGMTFDRRIDGEVLWFGVSGKLRNSDMIMYDRQTQSWWQQAVGRGIVGRMTGVELTSLPTWMESWEAFRSAHPDGLVMDEPSHSRAYGQNPYRNYDSSRKPFLYNGEDPPHGIDPLLRVLRVGGRAWPLTRLREAGRINEAGLTITWKAGQASALDAASIGQGRDVGNVRVRDGRGRDVAHDLMFAFAFHAFWPDGEWMLGDGGEATAD